MNGTIKRLAKLGIHWAINVAAQTSSGRYFLEQALYAALKKTR